jgi:hypothetical protein
MKNNTDKDLPIDDKNQPFISPKADITVIKNSDGSIKSATINNGIEELPLDETEFVVNLDENHNVQSVKIARRLDKQLESISESVDLEKPSLFSNIKGDAQKTFGVQQIVKEILDIAPDITEQEMESQERTRQSRASSDIKFEREGKGIMVDMNRLTTLSPQSGESFSQLTPLRTARFLQDTMALFSYATKKGSFRINAKLIDILEATGAYEGSKRIRQDRIKSFSDNILLALHLLLKTQSPTYEGNDGKVKKVGKYEIFERYFPLFGLTGDGNGILWATDRNGNKTYIKQITGEILPDLKDKGWLRGVVFPDGFFKLNAVNEANEVFLSSYFVTRFSQAQNKMLSGKSLVIDRRYLIEVARYQASDKANKSDASNKLEQALNRILEMGVISDWKVATTGRKEISTDDYEKVCVYPPEAIVSSLVSKEKKAVAARKVKDSEPLYIKKLKRFQRNLGSKGLADWFECSESELKEMIAGKRKLTTKQVEQLDSE